MDPAQLQDLPVDVTIDCQGEICPGPMLKAMESLNGMTPGQVLVLLTDVQVATQNVSVAVQAAQLAEVLGIVEAEGLYRLYLRKL